MVYVNSKKFACESCIKGHRSSSCHHTDRPLFEIKKKGRPVSQCNNCRELRQSKRVHSKCTCNSSDDSPPQEALRPLPGTKSKRFIPIVPALPNGLKDVLQASVITSSIPADARQRVDTLLNPCNCKSVWKCKCRQSAISDATSQPESGLKTLAHAASMCCGKVATSTTTPLPPNQATKRLSSPPGSPHIPSHKRPKHTKSHTSPSPGPELAPIYLEVSSSCTPSEMCSIPDFPTMPPMSEIASLAGSGCTCGLRCACPGCVEHRGPEHASKERHDCGDGCGTCIDHCMGPELPRDDLGATNNFLDKFFACAAALPAPPTNRRMGGGVDLDPMNITVYPGAARATDAGAFAFGLVNLPKLECCGGQCGCPSGACVCGQSCDGCCESHRNGRACGISGSASPIAQTSDPLESAPPTPPVVRSCCAGKA